MGMTFKWDASKFDQIAERAGGKGLEAAANLGAEYARVSIGIDHGGMRSIPGNPPNSQSGNLRRRIVWVGPKMMGPGKAAYGTDVRYGGALERGAVIHAKNVKYLTIPLNDKAAKALQRARSVRNIPDLVWRPPFGGKVNALHGGVMGKMIGGKRRVVVEGATYNKIVTKGRGKPRFEAWFALKSQVMISARPYLRPAFYKNRAAITDKFVEAAKREFIAAAGSAA